MKQHKRPLNVAVDVEQPSTIELTLGETVRLDRVRETPRGTVAEQHALLTPGTRTLSLAPGRFFFKTIADAELRVIQGGVRAAAVSDPKNPWPPPGDGSVAPVARGDDLPGKTPTFTIIR